MHLRLIVPHLFHFAGQLPLPGALSALRRGHRHASEQDDHPHGLEAQLCQLFGLRGYPLAGLLAAADGLDAQQDWLLAEPVHLALGQNAVSVQAGASLQLNEEQAGALINSLNELLAEDGLQLQRSAAQRWYLRLPPGEEVQFLPLPAALGKPLPPHTIHGPGAAAWKRRSAEMQMTLHQHPANEQREQAGLPPVNHIWLWGEGRPQQPPQAPSAQLWGDLPVLQALAQSAGQAVQPAPMTFAQWQRQAGGTQHIVLLDSLLEVARAGDINAFATALDALCDAWLAPALSAGLARLTLDIPGDHASCRYELDRWSRLRVWKNTHVGY